MDQLSASIEEINQSNDDIPLVCVCRRGNDSQIAAQKIKQELPNKKVVITDITGGLTAWAKTVDPDFPIY